MVPDNAENTDISKSLAMMCETPGQPLRATKLTLNQPRSDEVVVRIDAVGLCHTDWAIAAGVFPVPFPVVLGHEGTGVIEAVDGSNPTGLRVGDRVILSAPRCRACRMCLSGRPAYCEQADALAFSCCRSDGSVSWTNAENKAAVGSHFFGQSSFATRVVAQIHACVRIDGDIPPEIAAPMGCGIVTGWGSVTRSLDTHADDRVVIVGGGTVGLAAVCAARAIGCTTIIVVEPHESRRILATQLGATATVPADPDAVEYVRTLTSGGGDVVVATYGSPAAITSAIAMAGRCGRIGIVGGSQGGLPTLDVNDVLFNGKRIQGIRMGDQIASVTIPHLIEQWRAGRLPIEKLVTTFALIDINTAISEASSGRVVKAVLIPPHG
jgi:aryl-alcohol dehydrogenase